MKYLILFFTACFFFNSFFILDSDVQIQEAIFVNCDDMPPKAILKNGLTVSIDGDGQAVVTSRMFNIDSYDDTTPRENLFFSFSQDISDTLMTFNCSSIGIQENIPLWITDASDNQIMGEVFVLVQDNFGYCSSGGTNCRPSPIIKNGSIVNLQPNGEATIAASNFDEESFSNCDSGGSLIFSFSADTSDAFRTFNCDNIGIQIVQVWVTDGLGNIILNPAPMKKRLHTSYHISTFLFASWLFYSFSVDPLLEVAHNTDRISNGSGSSSGDSSFYISNFDKVSPSTLSIFIFNQINVSCFGENNGYATVDASGGTEPYTFNWSNGQSGQMATNLVAGVYSVTVMDALSSEATTTVTITEPPTLEANVSSTSETSPGANDGNAAANPIGGTPAFTYLWSNGQTTQMINNLAPGDYSVTVTDANNCIALESVVVGPLPTCNPLNDSLELVNFFNILDGPNWTNNTNWLVPDSSINSWYGIDTNADGCVTSIVLSDLNITGQLPDLNLPELQVLSISGSKLNGTLPDFSNVPNLRELNLGNNEMEGNIQNFPPLDSLRVIDIDSNFLSGTLPPFDSLPNLTYLDFNTNQLSGNLPNFSHLDKVYWMDFTTNELDGTIPNFSMPALTFLGLAFNNFSGTVPNFSGMPLLESIFINDNQLSGPFPDLENLAALDYLVLGGNQFTFDGLAHHTGQTYQGLFYSPQAMIFMDTTYTVAEGQYLEIDLEIDPDILANSYKWYQNGDVDTTIVGSNKLIFDPVILSDTGTYLVEVSNADVPNLVLTSYPITIVVNESCRYRDSLTLVAIYENTHEAGNWDVEWDLNQPIDTWFGVELNNEGCVSCIDLDGVDDCGSATNGGNNLKGILPPEIGQLGSLETLRLYQNDLYGNIPPEIGDLSNLELLSFKDNEFTGTIPDEILQLTNLQALSLDDNNLEGIIPPNIDVLENLTTLRLHHNQLKGEIPVALGNMTGLTRIYLHNNTLEGCFPDELSWVCNLGFSASSGPNGYNFTNNPKLPWQGDFDQFCEGEEQIGAICNDSINNPIPDVIQFDCICTHCYRQSDSLTLLKIQTDFANNTFWDPNLAMEDWIGINLNADGCVISIQLQDIFLGGFLNEFIGDLASLEILFIENAGLAGNIPSSIGNLSQLTELHLAKNNLEGDITAEIWNLTQLTRLKLWNNQLTGTISPEIENLALLQYLILSDNDLSGAIPDELWNLHQLVELNLSDNDNLSGSIPEAIGKMTDLEVVWLGPNQISGNLPDSIGYLNKLEILGLGRNMISGSLPSSIGNLVNLIHLDLWDNQLTGNIPDVWNNLTNLQSLELANNMLDGDIPPGFGFLTELENLTLSDNQLEGDVPNQLTNLTKLKRCLFHDNFLSSIPDFSSITTWSNDFNEGLYVQRNQLTFEHILFNMPIESIGNWEYAPQDSFFTETTYQRIVGESLDIDLLIDEGISDNQYQWYKDGDPDSLITGINSRTFDDLQLEDSGEYHCLVTNASAPDLILYSRSITIDVGCDLTTSPVEEEVNLCINQTVICAGQSFTSPGIFPVTLQSVYGCDSIVNCIINLIAVTPNDLGQITQCGGNLEICGNVINQSGNYMESCQSWQGCDSTVIVDLAILEPEANIAPPNDLGCQVGNTSVWLDGSSSTTTTANGVTTDFFWTGPGIISDPTNEIVEVDQGGEYCLQVSNERNGVQCTSEVCVDVSEFSIPERNLDSTLCAGDSIIVNGITYDENNPFGIEILDDVTLNGCDSIVNISLDFEPHVMTDFKPELCTGSSISVNGTIYNDSNPDGTEVFTGAAFNGCDSIVHVDVIFLPNTENDYQPAICPGESIMVNSTIYDEDNLTGTEVFPNAAANGCDSIVYVALELLPESNSNFEMTFCPGESILINGTVYDENKPIGTETFPGEASNGCDSILQINLEYIYPDLQDTIRAIICQGESYPIWDTVFTETDIYTDTIFSQRGCDSIYRILDLLVEDTLHINTLNDFFEFPNDQTILDLDILQNDTIVPNEGWSISLLSFPNEAGDVAIQGAQAYFTLENLTFTGTDYFEYAICQDNCPEICDSAKVEIRFEGNCVGRVKANLHTAFSPNNDGVNDTFNPLRFDGAEDCIFDYDAIQFTIFNRWGEVVFNPRIYPRETGWTGLKENGRPFPPGAYYFVLKFPQEGKQTIIKGPINLLL